MMFELLKQLLVSNNGFASNQREDSWYRLYKSAGGIKCPIRISNHGTHLWTWIERNFAPWQTNNICVVISNNGQTDSDVIIPCNTPLPKFIVKQYVYNGSLINEDDIAKIYESIRLIPTIRDYIDPLINTEKQAKYQELESEYKPTPTDTNNKRTSRNKASNTKRRFRRSMPYSEYDISNETQSMTYENQEPKTNSMRITEKELKHIVRKSVKKILRRIL